MNFKRENVLDLVRNKQFQKVMLLFIVVFIVGVMLVLPKSLAVGNQVVASVVIPSEKLNFEEKQAGAWRITESAEWIAKGEARITFDLDTIFRNNLEGTDFIFALDTSSSMAGNKLNEMKSSIKTFSDNLLNDPSNKISIINFNSEANLVVDFTDDKALVNEKVDSLEATGKTNYYNALVKVGEVLNGYQVEENRNCVVVFVVGSYPTEGVPNQDTYFKYLKEEYSNVVFNGIQYELGDTVSGQIENISDNQYIATGKNLNSKLVKLLDVSEIYEKFLISEFISDKYFNVEGVEAISVDKGTVSLDKSSQKIIWNIDNLKSGLGAKMEVKIRLKNDFLNQYDLYPVSEKVEVNSLIGEDREDVNNSATPILSNNHKVIYDGNVPDGCSPSNIPVALNKSVFDVVTISDVEPKCKGYQFKGWKVVTKAVEKVNSEHFIMPDEDVVIRAEWSKLKIDMTMDGRIYREMTLYDQVRLDYENDIAKKYTGPTDTFNGNQDVYYYQGVTTNNNVLFGGFCWKMYRTTDTGGVKMIYNGEPDSAGQCGSNRGSQVGYGARSHLQMDSSYLYGMDYKYDEITKKFVLTGNTEKVTWSDATYQQLLGKYTCRNTTGNCDTLYYIDDYSSNYHALIIPINNTTHYSQIGLSEFNNNDTSIADAGYMYNKRYITDNSKVMVSSTKDYIYGSTFIYDEVTQEYRLSGEIQNISNWSKEYTKLGNVHYTCWNSTGTCQTISYVYDYSINNSTTSYLNLEAGTSIEKALKDMLSADDVNKTNSAIKKVIDLWYSRNMIEYTDYLEDTVWCNSRRISKLAGWDSSGGSTSGHLYFWSYSNSSNLTCPDKIDSFTVDKINGNGALTYPVGLVTISEQNLSFYSDNSPLENNSFYWTLSPYDLYRDIIGGFKPRGYSISSIGDRHSEITTFKVGVRPSISIRAGIKYSDGDGSVDKPYVILTD